MSDGQFSSKPMRSGRPTNITSNVTFGSATFETSEAEAFLQSPSVQREVEALRDEPFHDIGQMNCTPMPRNTPESVRDLGRPIASAVLVQEYLIGLIFLRICGWIFIPFGLLFAFMGLMFLIVRMDPQGNLVDRLAGSATLIAMGLGIAASGLWFGVLRGRVVNQRCWLCPGGIVWWTNGYFEWFAWEDVPEVYCALLRPRPAIGIRFDHDISWISFGDTQANRRMVQYIEKRASAARVKTVLKLLSEGATIPFGDRKIHRNRLEDESEPLDWRRIVDVRMDNRELVLKDDRGETAIPMDDTPYPSLFRALARALVSFAQERF